MSDSEEEPDAELTATRRRHIHCGHAGYSLIEFEETYRDKPEKKTVRDRLNTCTRKCCSLESLKKSLLKLFPFIQTLKSYKITEDLPNDLISGLTVGIMMIPQGMAFGALSTLPPIVGLYISLFAPLTYFFFGTSRQSSLGCIAVLSLMMASILDKYDENVKETMILSQNVSVVTMTTAVPTAVLMSASTGSEYNIIGNLTTVSGVLSEDTSPEMTAEAVAKRVELAGAVTLVAGLITMIMGKCGFGFVITYMSNALITSFTVGVSIHVISSQLKNVFGLKLPRHTGIGKIVLTWYDMFANISKSNPATVIICSTCILIMYLVKTQVNQRFKSKMRIPVPIELIIVIAGTLASHYGYFQTNYDVPVVGNIPVGVPVPRLPNVLLAKDYIAEGMIIAIVAYAQTVSMAKTFGIKHNYKVDSNQEMFAIGSACLVCSIFSGFFTAASVSRSIVQDGAGGRTQVTSLIACSVVLLVIMVIGPYLHALPLCVLASIIIVNLRGMFMKLFTLRELWRKSRYDCTVWILTFLACVLLDTDIGLLIGVLVSLFIVVVRTQILSSMTVGIVSQTSEFRSLKYYKQVAELPGIKVIRLDAPLYFPNSEMFVKKVHKLTGINPIKLKKYLLKNGHTITIDDQRTNTESVQANCVANSNMEESEMISSRPQHIILDLSGVTFFDMMGVSALHQIIIEFEDIHIKVFVAEARERVMGVLRSNDFIKNHGHLMYTTLDSAVAAASATSTTPRTSVTDTGSTQVTSGLNNNPTRVQTTHSDIEANNEL
ncbi:sulfate transporter-like [Gigantopelta aegis]|uniref:sulfate transporter-like n=1 Tax=Gigantopelta aegis TaxID=1735272 RepID=UPI001B88E51B|nr:sulfate transporter-like [Gigantopelta aegis]